MYGVIDIGSNTIRLVVYQVADGRIRPMLNKKYIVGLAGYVDQQNRLTKTGIYRAVAALQELRTIVENIQIDALYVFATASLRNICNTDQALCIIRKETGYDVQVITGKDEALYDYYGALHALPLETGLLVDIGGGSTELVCFRGGTIECAKSLPFGSLNLHMRCVKDILPEKKERTEIRRAVLAQLDEVDLPAPTPGGVLCCVGGTARAAYKLIDDRYDDSIIAGQYEVKYLKKYLHFFEKHRRECTRQLLEIVPERIHTVIPGMIALKTIAEAYGCTQLLTSSNGVREGYLLHILQERGELHAD